MIVDATINPGSASYWGAKVSATYEEMINALGEPHYIGMDKEAFRWHVKNVMGEPCIINNSRHTVKRIVNGGAIEWHIRSVYKYPGFALEEELKELLRQSK